MKYSIGFGIMVLLICAGLAGCKYVDYITSKRPTATEASTPAPLPEKESPKAGEVWWFNNADPYYPVGYTNLVLSVSNGYAQCIYLSGTAEFLVGTTNTYSLWTFGACHKLNK